MNKRNLLGFFAAATMLFATSCSNDELLGVQSGNEATISFNLGVEDGVQTRTISDGKGANQLVYAVFDKDGNRISTIAQVNKPSEFPTEETITLAKGQTYKVAFWAQNSACEAYTVSDDMKVSIDYEGGNNDETRDAFFAAKEFTVTGHTNIDVTLKRPFAQINVGVTDADWNAAVASGIDIQTSEAVIRNAATSIDLLDGSVSGKANVTYDFAAIPKSGNEVLSVDTDGDGVAETYNYLSMSYILVNDENGGSGKATLEDLDFTFRPESGNDIVFSEGLNNVPVQRNWRTNIVGQILSGNILFNIEIDPIYDGETDVTVGGEKEEVKVYNVRCGERLYETLAEALHAGETDVVLSDGEYTLNVSGLAKDLKITGVSTGAKVKLADGDLRWNTVTFENLTIIAPATGDNPQGGAISVNGPAIHNNCVIENVYFCLSQENEFNGCTFNITDPNVYNVWTYGADVDFNDCVFNCAGKSALVYAHGSDGSWKTVNFKNCQFNASAPVEGKAAIEIDSSLCPYNVNIENCTAEGFGKGSVSQNSLYNLKKGTEGVNCNITVVLADEKNIANDLIGRAN